MGLEKKDGARSWKNNNNITSMVSNKPRRFQIKYEMAHNGKIKLFIKN